MDLPLVNFRTPQSEEPFTATVYALSYRKKVLRFDKKKWLYIGSTWMSLTDPLRSHKGRARTVLPRTGIHGFMYEQGIKQFDIQALEILENCVSRKQMREIEDEWIKFLQPVFNDRRAIKLNDETAEEEERELP